MENTTIEITEEKKKIGAGIIIMSALYLLINGFSILGNIMDLINQDEINKTNEALSQMGVALQVTTSDIIISLVVSLIIVTSVILILLKSGIGVFLFAGITVLNLVYNMIAFSFNVFYIIGSLIGLIIPALMLFFIYRKKDIYFKKS